jgi:uncharacterized SAM-binding protein YcdF (DUF218 family)
MLIASKLLWIIGQPISMVLILLTIGFILTFTRFRRTSRLSLFAAMLLLGTAAFTSVGYVLADVLENRFTRPATPPTDVTGIILLGGGMDADVNTARRGFELNRSGDRPVEALRLALAYPQAKIVVSGGGSVLESDVETEAVSAARFFTAFGIAADRIVVEDASRTTEENVAGIRQLVSPQPGDTWLLVTSAFHMPRSVGLFRSAGFEVVPWPADYLATGSEALRFRPGQPAENLSVTSVILREWAALASYWITGRIPEFLPGP